ncbi:CcmF [Pasteurella multocida subsp. multocida str. Anand1_goat]|nr:CcmF [Pasteurella multocida subsp. multocida str. Anand1_goat]
MIAELGNYALALSLAIAMLVAIFALWGAEKKSYTTDVVSAPHDLWALYQFNGGFCCVVLLVCGE